MVFACDMYGEGITGRDAIVRHVMELRNNRDMLCRRAQPAIDILSRHPQVDGRIAAVGYCFGGMTVLELARNAIARLDVLRYRWQTGGGRGGGG